MPQFDPRSLDDDELRPISPHQSLKPKSEVAADEGLGLGHRDRGTIGRAERRLGRGGLRGDGSDGFPLDPQWMAREHEIRQKVVDDWPETQRRQKEFDADLSEGRSKALQRGRRRHWEVVRDPNGGFLPRSR
jgi:hypothetical protein